MAKFRVIVADPPYPFSDKLSMSKVKRGAESQYKTLSIEDIKNLEVEKLCHDDAVLALWVPSSLLKEGIDIMEAWGFKLKQTHIWVKTKKEPFKEILRYATKITTDQKPTPKKVVDFLYYLATYNLGNVLAFGMGRLFRQTHEVVLIGTRGKIYKHLKNKSQRSVHFWPATKHSEKPENLQDMLDKMFPGVRHGKLELFARRDRKGWFCVGLECPSTLGEDIHDSIKRLSTS